MPEPITDKSATDDTVTPDPKDPKEVSGTPPTLDQVHAMNQAKVESEDENNEDDATGTDSTDNDADDAGDAGTGSDGEEKNDADDGAGQGAEDDKASQTPDNTAPQLDTDSSKPGDDKVAIKGFDGKTYYFNNLDEIPDDFEPASYKETMRAGKEFAKKEEREDREAADAKVKADEQAAADENKKRADAMQVEWERDAGDLTTAGLLPKDPTKNIKAKEEVYDYITAELKKGNVITNFKQAYKSMMYDREEAAKAKQQKEIDEKKKQRGGVVQPGGTAAPAPTGGNGRAGKVIVAPPQGAGLDAVHANATANL